MVLDVSMGYHPFLSLSAADNCCPFFFIIFSPVGLGCSARVDYTCKVLMYYVCLTAFWDGCWYGGRLGLVADLELWRRRMRSIRRRECERCSIYFV